MHTKCVRDNLTSQDNTKITLNIKILEHKK